MDILRKKLCALKFRKMHTKSEKNIKKKYFVVFYSSGWKEMLTLLQLLCIVV